MLDDQFRNTADSPIAPAETCFAITPDDTSELLQATKAIYVGSNGDIALVPLQGSTPVVFANVAAGAIIPVRARAVHASGTTCTNILGLA